MGGYDPHAAGASKSLNLSRRDIRQFFETGEFPPASGLRKRFHDEVRSLWFWHVVMPRRLTRMRAEAKRRRLNRR